MSEQSWPERIPAAIAEAEGWLEGGEAWVRVASRVWPCDATFTAGEVALAKALWQEFYEGQEPEYANENMEEPRDGCDAALRAFVEKVEALTARPALEGVPREAVAHG